MLFRSAGVPGLLVSTFAIVGPTSVLAFAVGRVMERVREAKWLKAVKAALAPITVGLMVASGLVTARAAGQDLVSIALVAGAAVFMIFFKRNPLWVICAGGLVGFLAGRVGLLTI